MNYANAFADFFKTGMDYNQFLTLGRRNAEAASEVGQTAFENLQAIARRSTEIARENAESVLKASKEIFTSGSPETNMAKQAAYAKDAVEAAIGNIREVSEMAAKSCFEIFDVVSSRATESIEELSKASGVAANTSKKKTAA